MGSSENRGGSFYWHSGGAKWVIAPPEDSFRGCEKNWARLEPRKLAHPGVSSVSTPVVFTERIILMAQTL